MFPKYLKKGQVTAHNNEVSAAPTLASLYLHLQVMERRGEEGSVEWKEGGKGSKEGQEKQLRRQMKDQMKRQHRHTHACTHTHTHSHTCVQAHTAYSTHTLKQKSNYGSRISASAHT